MENGNGNDLGEKMTALNSNVENLNKLTRKQVSFTYNFLLSLVWGIGYAIGASIVVGLLFAFLAKNAPNIPYLNKIDWSRYEQHK